MAEVTERPSDLDAGRAAVVARELVGTASGYLTNDVAMSLPFETLGPFKDLLKRFFSPLSWSDGDADELSELVVPHVDDGWWEHDLGGGLTLAHGIRNSRYELWIAGGGTAAPSIFDHVFTGPIVPEPTPHPRKVKFVVGGAPGRGRWYRRNDPDPPDDDRVRRLFGEADITDVMVAGDFVTLGLGGRSSWERRLEPLLALVTELFTPEDGLTATPPERTRDELLHEAGSLHPHARPDELHLLDPDDDADRDVLLDALDSDDARVRRVAVAILVETTDTSLRAEVVDRGRADPSLLVRRTTVDAAADTEDESLRPVFESALEDPDPWTRWKAVRAITELGIGGSRPAIERVAADPDFQVQFEAAAALRLHDDV